ncbi:hypothetical protein Ptr902_03273 [Pyrenophora tritici-repentis]|nr:hypothetical protein Ptr902_03273 [Pyrenophora tritici-repentis]
MLRPHSLPGGKLAVFFKPMAQWAKIDYLYGEQAWLDKNPLPTGKVLVGCVVQNLYTFYLLALLSGDSMGWSLKSKGIRGASAIAATMTGLIAAVMQLTTASFYISAELGSPVFYEQTYSITIWLVVTVSYLIASYFVAGHFVKYAFGVWRFDSETEQSDTLIMHDRRHIL